MKKAPDSDAQDKPRRRGRPASDVPPVPNAERQRAFRLRVKKEGKQMLHLAVLPDVVEQLDSLRADGSSREEVIERLVKAEVRRKKR